MGDGAVPYRYRQFDGEWHEVDAEVIEEGYITIFVNGYELATLMCTPRDPSQLALGFLANEGFIQNIAEVEIDHVCQAGDCVDIWLSHSIWDRPRRKIITSGCGGGLTFEDQDAERDPAQSFRTVDAPVIGDLMARLQTHDSLYARARGVHTSALSDGKELRMIAEDIGRHNTLDRLRGECMRQGIDPAGMILLATGRISSEMIHKAAKMGCEIVASRTSPTSLSVDLARRWNITLCGYVRRNRLNVYAHPERLRIPQLGLQTSPYYVVEMQSTATGD